MIKKNKGMIKDTQLPKLMDMLFKSPLTGIPLLMFVLTIMVIVSSGLIWETIETILLITSI